MNLVIDPTAGTHVLGSRFGRLLTTYRDREGDTFAHETVGKLKYVDDWLLVEIDNEIGRYYSAQIERRFGVKLHWRSLSGTHVSVIRGEQLKANADMWGWDNGYHLTIDYTHDVYTNGQHWWLNVDSPWLANVRGYYGLGTTKRWFHLTVGRV